MAFILSFAVQNRLQPYFPTILHRKIFFSYLSVDVGSVNSFGQLKAAVAREARYTYQTHLSYRGATYNGMWMNGEPHGRSVATKESIKNLLWK